MTKNSKVPDYLTSRVWKGGNWSSGEKVFEGIGFQRAGRGKSR